MKTNFIYALRNIKNNLTNSAITIIGLSVAIACCILVFIYASQEYSYNSFHENKDRIYRLGYLRTYVNGDSYPDTQFNPELVKKIKEQVPQVEKCTGYSNSWTQLMKFKDQFIDIRISYSNKDFFSIFSHEFIAGDKNTVFDNPHEVILTREYAEIVLGNESSDVSQLIGQSVSFPIGYEDQLFTITGIIENVPRNSGIELQGIIPIESGNNFGGCNNGYGTHSIYYLMKDGADKEVAENTMHNIVSDYYGPQVANDQGENILIKTDQALVPFSQPLSEVYFFYDVNNCYEATSNKKHLVILITIVSIILLIACSNYSILTLGQYMKKIGDIGVRKYMGANGKHIFGLFFTEGFILTFTAYVLGIFLCVILIPIFGSLSETEIFTELINLKSVVFFCVSSFFAILFLTSIVPVMIFSKVNPRQVSSKKFSIGKKSSLSQVFVSFQYAISIILIIVTFFIVKQSKFLSEKSLGVNTQNIITINNERLDSDQRFLFKKLLLEDPSIENVTLSARDFMNGNNNAQVDNGSSDKILVEIIKVDPDYIQTLEIKLLQGKNFTEANMRNNDKDMIVSRKFIEDLDIQDDPLGKVYSIWGNSFRIIGVMDNFHYRDLKNPLRPLAIFTRQNMGNQYDRSLVKYSPGSTKDAVEHIQKCYTKLAPGKVLEYQFWDDELGRRYEAEQRWAKIIGYAAAIAIIISSLGLLGLTILLINQRIKEIGVRKVNGAKAKQVLASIIRSFIIWLIGAFIIAAPLANWIVNKWLSTFPYHIEADLWVFVLSGVLVLILALVTVGWQSLRAAVRNPVEALRYE